MTRKKQNERARLHRLWATRRATGRQIERCMALDRQAETERYLSWRRGLGETVHDAQDSLVRRQQRKEVVA